jgi:hypothetical protein
MTWEGGLFDQARGFIDQGLGVGIIGGLEGMLSFADIIGPPRRLAGNHHLNTGMLRAVCSHLMAVHLSMPGVRTGNIQGSNMKGNVDVALPTSLAIFLTFTIHPVEVTAGDLRVVMKIYA